MWLEAPFSQELLKSLEATVGCKLSPKQNFSIDSCLNVEFAMFIAFGMQREKKRTESK